ncbi:hypothetical protein LEL_09469 [Akanthomyces lecanii RCEF 1005]|uniref:Uncharacterized protein n=1 Tax=Akanthomyces lecanii RCEF 1005 TaxID=1081108 RepID=A0A168C3B9_CORDF|nr:hypothetical protein LEL_09469 [Akanthomyces lecanii RCEF 1005]
MPEIRRGSSIHASSTPTSPAAASPSSQLPPILPPVPATQTQSHNDGTAANDAAGATTSTNLRSASIDHAGYKPPRRSITLSGLKPQRHSTDLASSILAGHHISKTTSPSAADGPSRRSLSYANREAATAYYDSRAATHAEWQRRAKTLEEYYDDNPSLLPQLPFTWHHGWRRWRLFFFAFLVFVDACAVPIALYYGMSYAGNVQGYIIFAVVTTIWGGPTYLEFAIRTLRLIKKERFYRPLGTNSRWCFDVVTYTSVITITAVTALFVVGSVPHIVWLRVLCMPAPAILYSVGGVMALIQLYNQMGWKAPFRLSSTPKGGKVLPPVYYFIEDVIAVNAGAGRPFREALAARYKASPRFRRMLYIQSIFWSIPAIIIAIPLTVIAVIHPVPATAAYGICWAVPFLWMVIWGVISVYWCKADMVRERLEWQAGKVDGGTTPMPHASPSSTPPPDKSQRSDTTTSATEEA